MSSGKDLIDWLLTTSTPSIRHAALIGLQGRSPVHAQVAEARRQIMRRGPVLAILQGQTARGNWQPERSYYTPKYTSTHWNMLLLAELDVDAGDPGVRLSSRPLAGGAR